MAEDPQAAVADPEPAAPPAEPQAQAPEAPESQPAGKLESESGEGPKLSLNEWLHLNRENPDLRHRTIQEIPEEEWEKEERVQSTAGRARQSGRQEIRNQQELREKDQANYRNALNRQGELAKLLDSELEPSERREHLEALREATTTVVDGDRRREAYEVFTSLEATKHFDDEDRAILHDVDGEEWPLWARQWGERLVAVGKRLGREEYAVEMQARNTEEKALQESLQRGETPRSEAPPMVPAGGTASDSTSDEARLDRIVAGTYTEQDRAWYSQKYGRNPASRR